MWVSQVHRPNVWNWVLNCKPDVSTISLRFFEGQSGPGGSYLLVNISVKIMPQAALQHNRVFSHSTLFCQVIPHTFDPIYPFSSTLQISKLSSSRIFYGWTLFCLVIPSNQVIPHTCAFDPIYPFFKNAFSPFLGLQLFANLRLSSSGVFYGRTLFCPVIPSNQVMPHTSHHPRPK